MLSLYTESSDMDVDRPEEETMGLDKAPDSMYLAAPPNSPRQAIDAAAMEEPAYAEPQHIVTVYGLFGPAGPSFPVQGTQAALQTLAAAMSNGIAVVKPGVDGDAIVDRALSHLQARGVVPDYHEEGILQIQNSVERAALGLPDDQFTLTPEEAKVLDTAYPRFLSTLRTSEADLDIAKILIMLKIFARYFQHTGKRYQLMVITKQEGEQHLDARIFSTQEGANETMFLYRKVNFNGFFGGAASYNEVWSPMSLPASAPRPARELDNLGRTMEEAMEQDVRHARTESMKQPAKVKKPRTKPAPPATPAPSTDGPRSRAKPVHSGIDVSAYAGMTPDEVFETVKAELASGTLHPDEVSGERLLLFAVAYSNVEIRDLLLPYNKQNHQTLATPNNVYNGRILFAIRASLQEGQSFAKAKAEFDDARKAYNLKTTSAMRGKSTQEVKTSSTPRKRKRAVKAIEAEEEEEEEPEVSDEDEDMEDEVEEEPVASPRPTRSTRGAKPRMSYRAAGEDFEDEEMEDSETSETDRARARYKRAKVEEDDESDEDADFELDD